MDSLVIALWVGVVVITGGLVAAAIAALRWKPRYCPHCTLFTPKEAKVCPHCHKDL